MAGDWEARPDGRPPAPLWSQCRRFPVADGCVRILDTPAAFFAELKSGAQQARERVALASLYLGCDAMERELVEALRQNLAANPKLQADIVLDYTRGTRGQPNSASLLRPLVEEFRGVNVSLYHSPQMTRLMRALLKPPMNEIMGLTHIKAYIFDDTLLISGANLSDHYFKQRQDRYVMVTDRRVADFFHELVQTVANHSQALQANGSLAPRVAELDPFNGSASAYKTHFREALEALLVRPAAEDALDASQSSTWVFPLLQMGYYGVRHDERITADLLRNAPADAVLALATGYFNLTPEYRRAILEGQAQTRVLTASPEANGFLGAKGNMGHIPSAYTYLEKLFLRDVAAHGQEGRVSMHEYARDGWTFHGKGLWLTPGGETAPTLTLVGSPNFGYRSSHRDLEAQLAISTREPALRAALQRECEAMYAASRAVALADLEQASSRRVHPLEALATHAIRSFL